MLSRTIMLYISSMRIGRPFTWKYVSQLGRMKYRSVTMPWVYYVGL